MKLITKLYLSFSVILIAFCFIIALYLYRSAVVAQHVRQALVSSELYRLSESMEKSVLDIETGYRGFQVSDNDTFLEPYHQGRKNYIKQLAASLQQQKSPRQLQRLARIDSLYQRYLNTFAEPGIQLQKKALASPETIPGYEAFQENYIRKGYGKRIMDQMRRLFKEMDQVEARIKEQQLSRMEHTMQLTNILAIVLATACLVFSLIVVYLLAKAIRSRLKSIATMADEVAGGHFNKTIEDTSNDEISQVAESLNIMARKLDYSFTNLDKINKELDQFAYVVSHDLKAPLRAINNLAEWISEDLQDVDPDVQRNLDLMRGRVQRMENLINGILDYSRIGRKQLPRTKVQVGKLVDEVIEALAPPANVKISIEPGLPEIQTERVLLYQVFSNLIGNAIKYNDKPEPEVEIGVRPLSDACEFYVQDNGPGIPEEYHQRVFGIFQTMEARDTVESTGIGLAIVKKIVEEKGGSIRIESGPGKGSRFIFTWPTTNTSQPDTIMAAN